MRVLEYGKEHERTLLFLPCTAEPEWVFADSVGLLSQDYHVMQIVYDGHGETGEDFISVETTVDEITDWLQARGITRLNAAYGCSLGGACLTRFLALGKIPVECAVIDAGITPYQMPLVLRRLACLRDFCGFSLIAKSRKILEAAYETLLPYLCKTDHYLAEVMHARLIRTQTEALGGDCCDYWYVGDKSPVLEKYKDLAQI